MPQSLEKADIQFLDLRGVYHVRGTSRKATVIGSCSFVNCIDHIAGLSRAHPVLSHKCETHIFFIVRSLDYQARMCAINMEV